MLMLVHESLLFTFLCCVKIVLNYRLTKKMSQFDMRRHSTVTVKRSGNSITPVRYSGSGNNPRVLSIHPLS